MSGRPGSNRPPEAWKATALPNELLPLIDLTIWKFVDLTIPGSSKFKRTIIIPSNWHIAKLILWAVVDSNHRSRKTADLQSAPFGHSGNCPVSRRLESNQRPTDYKSVALPTELLRPVISNIIFKPCDLPDNNRDALPSR